MKASVVIGANFGDEGKGNVTNWLSDENTTVVRFNGGAQAGHTVVAPDGSRTVFSHIGSGSWKGANTWLSQDFVINPMVFRKEHEALIHRMRNTTIIPKISYDYRCRFTTPWDIILNQELEMKRADDRHGSVGLGFGETIERYEQLGLMSTINSFNKKREGFVKFMIDQWVPARAKDLDIESRIEFMRDKIASRDFINRFYQDLEYFLDITTNTEMLGPNGAVSLINGGDRSKKIVFEGAQGLLLDQHFGTFPHVTRSSTGLANIDSVCKLLHITELEVYYVTRCYLTRHGAGPLSFEMANPPVSNFKDETNKPNPFQGTLRFAPLDPVKLRERIMRDLSFSKIPKKLNLVVTCMDQIGDDEKIPMVIDGAVKDVEYYDVISELMGTMYEFNVMTCYDADGSSIRDYI